MARLEYYDLLSIANDPLAYEGYQVVGRTVMNTTRSYYMLHQMLLKLESNPTLYINIGHYLQVTSN